MSRAHEYDYETHDAGTPKEYDSVTLDGHEFARIIHVGHSYQVKPTMGSQAGEVLYTRGAHHTAFEDCMDYASLERLPEKFGLEMIE
jgi:hypothetical protein